MTASGACRCSYHNNGTHFVLFESRLNDATGCAVY